MTELNKKHHLTLPVQPGKTRDEMMAQTVISPLFTAAGTVRLYSQGIAGELDVTATINTVAEMSSKVHAGDMQGVETMLTAQAVALNSMFAELARRAAINMGDHLNATETYMRMALKAQTQCRATLETLAEVKNPRVTTFVRQQNNAEQQVVNNGILDTGTSARTGKNANQANELLTEDTHAHLDTGATATAGRSHPQMETLGAIDRTSNTRGKRKE